MNYPTTARITRDEIIEHLTYKAVSVYLMMTTVVGNRVRVRAHNESVIEHLFAVPRDTLFDVIHNFSYGESEGYWLVFTT